MDNVTLFVLGVILICVFIFCIYKFAKLGWVRQLEIIQEWLLLAVIKAEKELGSGTGQIKLRYVYDLFIEKFKFSSMFITFSQFSLLVDSALIVMKVILTDNKNVQEYVTKN